MSTWERDDTSGGGGAGSLEETLDVGNEMRANQEIRPTGGTAGDGFRVKRDSAFLPTWLFGDVSVAFSQNGWVVSGDDVVLGGTGDNGYLAPSLIHAYNVTADLDDLFLGGSQLFGEGHTFGAGHFSEYLTVFGTDVGFNAGGYSAWSLIMSTGTSNTIDSLYGSILLGQDHTIGAVDLSLIVGESHNVINMIDGIVVGVGNRVEGASDVAAVIGNGAWGTRRREYVFGGTHSGTGSNNVGQAQFSFADLADNTTTGAESTMSLGSVVDGSLVRYVLHASSALRFKATITAYQTAGAGAGSSACWDFEGLIRRDGANNTTMVAVRVKQAMVWADASGSVQFGFTEGEAGAAAWLARVDADDATESLRIRVQGEAAKTIRWSCRLETVEAGVGTARL